MKQKRQRRIIEIINHNIVETQEELADLLRAEGFAVTQATVSRDIKELGLTKVSAQGGGQRYAVLKEDHGKMTDKYVRILSDGLISAETAGNLLVLKTVSGMAMLVTSLTLILTHVFLPRNPGIGAFLRDLAAITALY